MTELNQPPQLAIQAARRSEVARVRRALIAKLKALPERITHKEALALYDQAVKEVAR